MALDIFRLDGAYCTGCGLPKNKYAALLLYTLSLFDKHPGVQAKYFPHFNVAQPDVLRGHGTKVLMALANIVESVKNENDSAVVQKINYLVHSHKRRGIRTIDPYKVLVLTPLGN